MAKRSPPKSAFAGLRSIQKIGVLAVPGTLEEVPEEVEVKLKKEIFGTDDWKSVEKAVREICRKEFAIEDQGNLYSLHQNVKNILRSRTGTFLRDCYKEWLTKELSLNARRSLGNLKGYDLLQNLENIWTLFYSETLPLLEAVLYQVKPKGRVSMRSTTLAVFRDLVFFSEDIEGAIHSEIDSITPELRHAILILQNVNDTYPPCKNKLRLEALMAKICSSFIGYYGLFENGKLVVSSNEPLVYAKRRPSSDVGPRRISRPFSVQPQQMDTLNQLFKKAIRQKLPKVDEVPRIRRSK